MTRPDELLSLDAAPNVEELLDLLLEALVKRPDIAESRVVVEVDGAICDLRSFRLGVHYPDPETEKPERIFVLAGVEVGDYRKVIKAVGQGPAWYEDNYGRAICFFCARADNEPHAPDCAFVLARTLINLDPPTSIYP